MTTAALKTYGGSVLACFAIAWLISLAWWRLLPDPRVVPLHVLAGTGEAVRRGEVVDVLPATLVLRGGDTLVVRNDDVVTHRIGWQTIAPGTTVRMAVTEALLSASSLLCSIHPSGAIAVSPRARAGLATTVIPTVLIGVPVSVVLVVAMLVARGLREEGEDGRPDHRRVRAGERGAPNRS